MLLPKSLGRKQSREQTSSFSHSNMDLYELMWGYEWGLCKLTSQWQWKGWCRPAAVTCQWKHQWSCCDSNCNMNTNTAGDTEVHLWLYITSTSTQTRADTASWTVFTETLTPGRGLCAGVWWVWAAAGRWADSDWGRAPPVLQRSPASEPKLHRPSDPEWCDWGPVLHPGLHTETPPVSLSPPQGSQEPETAAGGERLYRLWTEQTDCYHQHDTEPASSLV